MEIVQALQHEESKLQRKLAGVRGAIAALNGGAKTAVSSGGTSSSAGTNGKRTMSPAVRAKLSRSAKLRWAKIRAGKAKKTK